MTRVSHATWTLALCGMGFVACGARTGLLVGDLEVGMATDSGTTDASMGDDGSCMGAVIPLDLNAPNLYFVLDHSTSMNEMGKWTNMRTVVADLMNQIGPGARFGTAMFPPPPGDTTCGPGVEVMSVRQGDTQGATANAFLAATASMPNGGTPTAATLRALRPELIALSGGSTFVILATDGGPNCNPDLSCQVGACTLNIDGAMNCPLGGPNNCCAAPPAPNGIGCLDGTATAQAAADLDTAGIQTFVMGIPGSAPYSTVLDEIAVAGGTSRSAEPLYFRVDTSDTGALAGALAQIAMQTGAGCTFSLKTPASHPGGAQVTVGGAGVAPGGQDGWSLSGSTLSLGGASCNAARNAGAMAVKLVDGCER